MLITNIGMQFSFLEVSLFDFGMTVMLTFKMCSEIFLSFHFFLGRVCKVLPITLLFKYNVFVMTSGPGLFFTGSILIIYSIFLLVTDPFRFSVSS